MFTQDRLFDMEKEAINHNLLKVGDPGWAIQYCLSRLSELRNLKSMLKHLLVEGGIGGDIDWGIHKWDEHTEEDYGIKKFDGYRYYVGENDHGILGHGNIEEFTSEKRLKELLSPIVRLYMHDHPAEDSELKEMANRLGIEL
jgi:hypothetical protein